MANDHDFINLMRMSVLGTKDWMEMQIANLWRDEKRKVSLGFLMEVDQALTQWLLKRFEWSKIPKQVHINSYVHAVAIDEVSTCSLSIWAGSWNDTIKVSWKSKSGKIYEPQDDPEAGDFECWISRLNEEAFLRALYGPTSLPFKLTGLSFKIAVGAIDMSMTVLLVPKDHFEQDELQQQIDRITIDINEKSHSQKRNWGVVHNWQMAAEKEGLRINFDLGSAGFTWMKHWLQALSAAGMLSEIRLGRFAPKGSS
jgi:hypothetical protein